MVLFTGAVQRYSLLSCTAGSRTAAELLAREAAARRIITFCGNLDEVLGGGVATGQLTEFCASLPAHELLLRAQLCRQDDSVQRTWTHLNAACYEYVLLELLLIHALICEQGSIPQFML